MKKLLIIISLFIIKAHGFAQEPTETISTEEAQVGAKGLMKELFMFQMAKDVLEIRQLISDNELGDSVENYMNNYDNALFFKSTLDYDFFWNSVLGRKKYKVPSSQLFLDDKDKYLENNEVDTSIDFDIVLTPHWEDPDKEDKLKDYSVKITSGNFTNLSFSDDEKENLNAVLNSPFTTNVATPKEAKVNEAVFNGLAALRPLCEDLKIDDGEVNETEELINLAVTILGEAEFGRSDRGESGKYDSEFWKVGNCVDLNNSEVANSEIGLRLTLIEDKNPSDAVHAIYSNPSDWSIDCAEFIQITLWYLMIEKYDDSSFDNYIKTIIDPNSDICSNKAFTLKLHGSTGIITQIKYARYYSPDDKFWDENIDVTENPMYQGVPETADEILNNAPMGTRIAVKNLAAESFSAWEFENAIKIGHDLYAAHGFGSTNKFTLEQIKEKLARITYENDIPFNEYLLKNVFVAEIEIYDTDIK
ncbi:MAG: hypothetical protein GQ564_06350 [Bacteroidales bacterium]|nr:hypothetical protein [Bacteroidales bacterium]